MAKFQATLAVELKKKFLLQSLAASSSLGVSATTDPIFWSLSPVSGIQSMPAEIKAILNISIMPPLEVSQTKLKKLEEEPMTRHWNFICDMIGGVDDDEKWHNDVVEQVNNFCSKQPVKKSKNHLEWLKENSNLLPNHRRLTHKIL